MRNFIELRRANVNPVDFLDDFYSDLNSLFDSSKSVKHQGHAIRCELSQKDEHFIVSLDTPGVSREDLTIEVLGNVLNVSGKRKKLIENTDYSEKHYGEFTRKINLPKGFDAEKIQAHYENGVLTVAIAKLEKPEPKKIDISEDKKGIWSDLLSHEETNIASE